MPIHHSVGIATAMRERPLENGGFPTGRLSFDVKHVPLRFPCQTESILDARRREAFILSRIWKEYTLMKDNPKPTVRMIFNKIAQRTTEIVGSPITFLLSIIGVLCWFLSGPFFHFSDAWQLVLNTGLSIGTFLIVLLLQNNQNREGKAVQLKLDELIRGAQGTRNALVNLEEYSEEELEALQREFRLLRERQGKLPVCEEIAAGESGASATESLNNAANHSNRESPTLPLDLH